jgi:nucleotide-binding universal stress UspA family protein
MGSFRHGGDDVDAGAVFEPISVAEGVRRYLRIRPATLIAVTSHADGGFSRFVHGNATADIVFSSPVAVLVLPGPR